MFSAISAAIMPFLSKTLSISFNSPSFKPLWTDSCCLYSTANLHSPNWSKNFYAKNNQDKSMVQNKFFFLDSKLACLIRQTSPVKKCALSLLNYLSPLCALKLRFFFSPLGLPNVGPSNIIHPIFLEQENLSSLLREGDRTPLPQAVAQNTENKTFYALWIEKDPENLEFFDEKKQHIIPLVVQISDKESDHPQKNLKLTLLITANTPNAQIFPSSSLAPDDKGLFHTQLTAGPGNCEFIFSVDNNEVDSCSLTLRFIPYPEDNFLFSPKGNTTELGPISVPLLIPSNLIFRAPKEYQRSDFIWFSSSPADISVTENGECKFLTGKISPVRARCLNVIFEINFEEFIQTSTILSVENSVALTLESLQETLSALPQKTRLPTKSEMTKIYTYWGSFKNYPIAFSSLTDPTQAWFWISKGNNSDECLLFDVYSGATKSPENDGLYYPAWLMDASEHLDFFATGTHLRPWTGEDGLKSINQNKMSCGT